MPEPLADVLVLGAGLAGLAAARRLGAARLHVVVLEARERLGGRLCTEYPCAGLPVELGAEFVHGHAPLLTGLIERAGLATVATGGRHLFDRDGTLGEAPGFWVRVQRLLAHVDPASDRPAAELFGRLAREGDDPEAAGWAVGYLEGFNAADLRRMSERAVAAAESGGASGSSGSRWLVGGYDRLVQTLAADLGPTVEVRTGHPVRRLRWTPGSVEADGDEWRCTGRRGLVTLPLGVLKAAPGEAGAVGFEPPLDEKRAALAGLEMGRALRLTLRFRERWWPADVGFIHGEADATIPIWWTRAPLDAPLFTAWAGGPRADALARLGPDRLADLALAELAAIFRRDRAELDRLLAGVHYHDWAADPWARGAYSYVAVGGKDASTALARPLADTLFFAGEATAAPGDHGTVQAALDSGERAAGEILAGRAPLRR